MTRGLVRTLMFGAALAAAGVASAQTPGDPYPFVTSGTSTTVLVLGSCDEDTVLGAIALGGTTVLASHSPGGPLVASVPRPYPSPPPPPEAGWCPSLFVPGPPPGTYWVVMVYGLTNQTSAPASAWRQVVVGPRNCVGRPLPPVLASSSPVINGHNVAMGFTGAAQGCAISHISLEVGTTPGGREIGVYGLPGMDTFFPNVPPGSYYVRARGVNAFGVSNRSTEIPVRLPGPCGIGELPPTPINPTANVNGGSVTVSWSLSPATGATFHQVALLDPGSLVVLDHFLVPAATSFTVPHVPPGAYRISIAAGNACGTKAMVPNAYLDLTVP